MILFIILGPHVRNPQFSLCVGCGGAIHDQFILRVAPNLEWHAACLKCTECQMFLDETCTCFVRDGKTYCKKDYVRYRIKRGNAKPLKLPSTIAWYQSLNLVRLTG